MKAEDLMLGDWVCVMSSDGLDTHFFKIKTILERGVNSNGFVEFADIKPISLTEEILEKNGYSYSKIRDAWELTLNNGGFGICKDEDNNCFYFCLGVFDALNSYRDITYHYITKVEYVHELQHALKLCGIDKEIVL